MQHDVEPETTSDSDHDSTVPVLTLSYVGEVKWSRRYQMHTPSLVTGNWDPNMLLIFRAPECKPPSNKLVWS